MPWTCASPVGLCEPPGPFPLWSFIWGWGPLSYPLVELDVYIISILKAIQMCFKTCRQRYEWSHFKTEPSGVAVPEKLPPCVSSISDLWDVKTGQETFGRGAWGNTVARRAVCEDNGKTVT